MKDLKAHRQSEQIAWEERQAAELKKLKGARWHLSMNVVAYVGISVVEFYLAIVGRSQTLRADALNNLSGIISTALLLMGNHIASDIDDDDLIGQPLSAALQQDDQRLQLTRFRYETVFTLITGIVMVAIAGSVMFSGVKSLLHTGKQTIPQPVTLVGAGIAAVIMLIVWWSNRRAGRKLQNASLTAAAQDSLSDAVTSVGTLIAIAGALLFRFEWLDGAASIVVGIFILTAGVKIFRESSLNLADYFDPQAEEQFRQTVMAFSEVQGVRELNAHYNGNVVTLDLIIEVDPHMEVQDSYRLGEEIEATMRHQFGIVDTDVMAVPKD